MAKKPAKKSRSTGKSVGKTRVGKNRAPSKSKPIELFYWPTPNGWKIIHHA